MTAIKMTLAKAALLSYVFLVVCVSGSVAQQPLPNDLIENAIVLDGTDVTINGYNLGATLEANEPGFDWVNWNYCTNTVWYKWTAPADGFVTLLCFSRDNIRARAFRGNPRDWIIAEPTTTSEIPVKAGECLHIQVGSYADFAGRVKVGSFTLKLSFRVQLIPVSPNDTFMDASVLDLPEASYECNLSAATTEPDEPLPSPQTTHSLWWRFTAPDSGLLAITVPSAQFVPKVEFFEGAELRSLQRQTPLAQNRWYYRIEAHREYRLQVAAEKPVAGEFALTSRFYSTTNDSFAGSTYLAGTNLVVCCNNLLATAEPGEPITAGLGKTVWYSWIAPDSGRVTLQHWLQLAVFTGPALHSLKSVEIVPGFNARNAFYALKGTVYHFQVDSTDPYREFVISIEFEPAPTPPPNDNFADASVLTGYGWRTRGWIDDASMERGEPEHLGTTPCKSIWWAWVAPCSGEAVIGKEMFSTAKDTTIAVYTGPALGALELVAKDNSSVRFKTKLGQVYWIAVATSVSTTGDIWLAGGLGCYGLSDIVGNLLCEPSFEGTALALSCWHASGILGGYVNEGGGADGSTWPVLTPRAKLWQDFSTEPGKTYELRFACNGDLGARLLLRVLWDTTELGIVDGGSGSAAWYWTNYSVTATGTTSRITFENLGPAPWDNVGLDAVSVVSVCDPPVIVTPPSPARTWVGSDVSFAVGATGTPPLHYQWFFGDAPMPTMTNAVLVLSPATPTNAGLYFVVITNLFGVVTSAPVSLVVEERSGLEIVLQPYGDTVPSGTYFALSVAAVGPPPLQFQWYLNGNEVPGATNRQLIFDAIAPTDAGTYTVKVWNQTETVWSVPATLIVQGTAGEGGWYLFDNDDLPGGRQPVYDLDGTTKLSGPSFVAQLYAGPTVDSLRPVGKPRQFITGTPALGIFERDRVFVPTIEPGAEGFLQVRAWDSAKGASYEEARATGGKFGKSNVFKARAAAIAYGATPLSGLESFRLQAGLPKFVVGKITFVQHREDGALVWLLEGQAGSRYVIQKSVGDFVWRPFLVLTNETGVVTFMDSAAGSTEPTLYRARILD